MWNNIKDEEAGRTKREKRKKKKKLLRTKLLKSKQSLQILMSFLQFLFFFFFSSLFHFFGSYSLGLPFLLFSLQFIHSICSVRFQSDVLSCNASKARWIFAFTKVHKWRRTPPREIASERSSTQPDLFYLSLVPFFFTFPVPSFVITTLKIERNENKNEKKKILQKMIIIKKMM